jgi:hypothetical protein
MLYTLFSLQPVYYLTNILETNGFEASWIESDEKKSLFMKETS